MAILSGSTLHAGPVAPADRLDTLAPWPWDILDDEAPRTLGWHAIAWAEGWSGFPGLVDGWRGLVQPNGPRARKRFRLTDRQRVFLLWFYALDDEAQWLFAYAVRRLAKGSGKSPFAAVHCLIEFLGPVRLATFRRGAPGGCEGRQVDMPLVQIAATAESQTKNTMRMVRAFAPKGSHVVEFYGLDPGLTRYYGLGERTLEVITSSVSASEGAESSFVVMDELEHWRPSNAGPDLAATLADNLAKSGARALGTCNAWEPGAETVAETDWDAWLMQEEGRLKDDAGRTLYDAVVAPPDTEMSDPASLEAALQWVYHDCEWKIPPDADGEPAEGAEVDVRPIMGRIWSPRSRPDDSQRKYLNRPTAALDAWTTPEAWARLVDTERVVVDGEPVAMFFDGSRSQDATALIGCCISDGHVFTVNVWEPDPGDDQDVVPVHDVDLAVARSFERWDVQGFFADVREWESFAKVSWPEAYADKLKIQAVPGGKDPQAIAWDMRSKTFDFTVACELALAEIDEQGFTHDGDARLGRHVANARRRPNRYGVSIGKESPDSRRKIDAAVAMIGARMVRRLVLAAPKGKRPGKVYAFGHR
ncbi:MAG: terminase [Candidatus Neomicrothrix subdominans]